MTTFQKRIGTAALLGAAFLGLTATPAQAQVRQWGIYAPGINPNAPFYNRANPFQFVAPGVSLQSALINTVNTGRAASTIPPWLYGYNPYPPINIGPAYQYPGYSPLGYGGGGYSPYLSTGYGGGGYGGSSLYGGAGYGGAGYGGSTLSTGYNPYAGYTGGGLSGAADVLFADGRYLIQEEQARKMRTDWKVAELDYRKKLFDYNEYIRANTPTFAETQEKLAASVLRRIQNTASIGEIWSGQAQNVLLKDFAKLQLKKLDFPEMPIPEEVLRKINVTSKGANMGALRNGGDLSWPTALSDLAPKEIKRDMDVQARELYRQAEQTGKADPATAKDLRTNIRRLRDLLVGKVSDLPTDQYSDSKEFLNNLDEAIRAVERGDAPTFFEFQKFVRGEKRTVQDLVNYMNERGLTFAPASMEGDAAAYQALQQAMAAADIAMHDQLRATVSTRN